MARATNQYRPDYAVPPGWVLEEHLEAHGISHAEFARRCGRSPKLISEVIAGKAPLEPETALQFEKVLARILHEKEPSGSMIGYNSVSWTGYNQEPDGDGM